LVGTNRMLALELVTASFVNYCTDPRCQDRVYSARLGVWGCNVAYTEHRVAGTLATFLIAAALLSALISTVLNFYALLSFVLH
jgi:hypothetical protein